MLNLRLWPQEFDAVTKLGKVQMRSKTDIVRCAIRLYLKQEGISLPNEMDERKLV